MSINRFPPWRAEPAVRGSPGSARQRTYELGPRPGKCVIKTLSRMLATLGRNRSPLLYETAIPGPEHREVGRSVVVPAGARSP